MAKIAFIGAGSATFTRNLIADLLTFPALGDSEVWLMDVDERRLGLVDRMARKMIAQQHSLMTVHSTTDRPEALRGAGYVVVTIAVGGLDAWEMDLTIPLRYGIDQCYGDILGPGGVFRGLRHLNVISGICRELEELSPDAVLLQYTNPMVMICRAIEAQSPLRHVGLCHSVQGTSDLLASFLAAPPEDLHTWAAGINHMAWFLKLEWGGRDVYPLLREKMADPGIYGQEPVSFEIMKHFGYFPSESSAHQSEYHPWFRKRADILDDMIGRYREDRREAFAAARNAGAIPWLRRDAASYFRWFDEQLREDHIIEISRSREYGARIINAMETDEPARINGNVANSGAIANLPDDSCVEVPCLVDANGIHACHVGKLPEQLAALNRSNLNVHELAAMGFVHRDQSLVRQAIKLDPLSAAICSLDEIDEMVSEMLEKERQWLPLLR